MSILLKGQKFRILGLFFSMYFPKFLSKCYSYSDKRMLHYGFDDSSYLYTIPQTYLAIYKQGARKVSVTNDCNFTPQLKSPRCLLCFLLSWERL